MPRKNTKAQSVTAIHSHKIKPLNFLLNSIEVEHPDLKIPKYALLIGAGCSLQCGIPLGSDIIALCKMHTFFREQAPDSKRVLEDCRTKRNEIEKKIIEMNLWGQFELFVKEREKWMTDIVQTEKETHVQRLQSFLKSKEEGLWEQYKEVIEVDNSYGFWMNQYSEESEDRQRFIEEIMDDRQPDGAYIILSYLIEKRKFTNILTTNFDDLVNEAVMYYTEQRCRFYVDDELSQYISIHNKKPNIIKLHGDYRFANMKNTPGETERLTDNISSKLRELLRHLGLVMVGYNGADYSIMSTLQEFKEHYKYPLIWCGMDANKVHWRVAHLINNTDNSFFVEIKGFDWLMGQLAIKFLSSVPDIEQKARDKKKIMDTFLEKFKVRFEESGGSAEEIAKLDETMDKWEELRRANADEDYQKVLAIETEIINSGKGESLDYSRRAYAYIKLKEFTKAIEDCNKAIELDPKETLAYSNRGNSYYELKVYTKAIEDYTKTIELDPKDTLAYNNRGTVYSVSEQYTKAIEDYTRVIELDPKDALAYKNRGDIYCDLKEYSKAIENYTKAIELDPVYATAHNNRGNAYFDLKQFSKAIEDYTKAIELNTVNATAYCNRGNAYIDLDNYVQAIEDLTRAIELDPNYALAYNNRGYGHSKQEYYLEALNDFSKAIELDQIYPNPYKHRATVHAKLQHYEQAKSDLDQALSLKPDYLEAYEARAELFDLMGEKNKAKSDRNKIKKLKAKE